MQPPHQTRLLVCASLSVCLTRLLVCAARMHLALGCRGHWMEKLFWGERIFIELMTSDRKLKASIEGSK